MLASCRRTRRPRARWTTHWGVRRKWKQIWKAISLRLCSSRSYWSPSHLALLPTTVENWLPYRIVLHAAAGIKFVVVFRNWIRTVHPISQPLPYWLSYRIVRLTVLVRQRIWIHSKLNICVLLKARDWVAFWCLSETRLGLGLVTVYAHSSIWTYSLDTQSYLQYQKPWPSFHTHPSIRFIRQEQQVAGSYAYAYVVSSRNRIIRVCWGGDWRVLGPVEIFQTPQPTCSIHHYIYTILTSSLPEFYIERGGCAMRRGEMGGSEELCFSVYIFPLSSAGLWYNPVMY